MMRKILSVTAAAMLIALGSIAPAHADSNSIGDGQIGFVPPPAPSAPTPPPGPTCTNPDPIQGCFVYHGPVPAAPAPAPYVPAAPAPQPVYEAPAPVYVAPAPAPAVQQQPVYVPPAPSYMAPGIPAAPQGVQPAYEAPVAADVAVEAPVESVEDSVVTADATDGVSTTDAIAPVERPVERAVPLPALDLGDDGVADYHPTASTTASVEPLWIIGGLVVLAALGASLVIRMRSKV